MKFEGVCSAWIRCYPCQRVCIPLVCTIIFQFLATASGQMQAFTTEPTNTSVIQGQSTVLNCAVDHLEGTLTWKKDGIILGTERELPGYPRYSITGDAAVGGNLQIENAELSDDATYICVIFATASQPQLNSQPALLSLQVPPGPPSFDNFANASLVSVKPPAEVTLTCRSSNGKPAPTITWMKNDEPLLYTEPAVTIEDAGDPSGKLKNIASTLHLQPEKEDNGIVFMCKIEHSALPQPMMVTVTMNVLFPPSPPLINGYTEGTIVRTGDELRLECLSRGGNPLAEVYWYKNGERMDFSYTTDGRSARNVLPLVVGYGDNNALYRCEATSVVLDAPMTTEIQLTVLFAPAFVNVTGHENMVASGATLSLSCTSGNSNPASFITWWSVGRQVQTHQDVVTDAPNGGYITQQNLTVTMTADVDRVDYMCQATNQELLETVDKTVTVSVMYPPGQPTITGYTEGSEVRAGNILRMQCYSHGGNPLATLKWLKNGNLQEAEHGTSSRVASSEMTIILDQTDNGAIYACNASNTATPVPLQAKKVLNVLFPPNQVTVTAEPAVAREGESVTIKCLTGSSNPTSDVSWWRDGIPFGDAATQKTLQADNGGMSTKSKLVVESLTWENNGGVYLCRAMNELLVESVNDGLTLDVRYAPKITTESGIIVRRKEEPGLVVLNCSLHANPSAVTYLWKKDGTDIVIGATTKYTLHAANGSLSIQDATRAEAGVYTCVATNEEGSGEINAIVAIEYSPTITTADSITITLHTMQEIICEVDANPRPDGFITWTRGGFDISMHTQEFREGQGVLRLANVSKADAGMYTCHANNGIEPAVQKDINIIIQFIPEIDNSIPNKVAKATDQTAFLRCRAQGAPVVRFKWLKDQMGVNMTSAHYTLDVRQDVKYANHYESRLIISELQITDYGTYVCQAYNDLGSATFQIFLEKTSVPDAPSDLMVVVVTYRSVTLNWTAGFNGGVSQAFQVRFNKKQAKQYQYIDVNPTDATIYTVENLDSETVYFFTVRGRNSLGDGPYFLGVVDAKTKVAPFRPTVRPAPVFQVLPLYAMVLVAFIIVMGCVFINLFLCSCLLKKRTRKTGSTDKDAIRPEIELVRPSSEAGDSNPLPESVITHSRPESERDRDSYEGSDYYSNHSRDRYSDDQSHPYKRHYDDDHSYNDERSYMDDRSYQDDRLMDEDRRPMTPSEDRMQREPSSGYYNQGYERKNSYQPSWDSYYPSGQGSEMQEEMDYAHQLRQEQQAPYHGRYPDSIGTVSPVPSSLGNFVPLRKAGGGDSSVVGSEKGYLV